MTGSVAKEKTVNDLTFYALLSVLQNGMMLRSDINGYLKRFKISHGQFSILLAVYEAMEEGLIANDLAAKLYRNKATIAKMTHKLIRDAYLVYEVDVRDKRKKRYRLTERANRLLGEAVPAYAERLRAYCADISDIEKYRLITVLNKLNGKNFIVRRSILAVGDKNRLIEDLCASGGSGDIDLIMDFLDDDVDIPTTKIVDFHLSAVANPEGVKRIEYYLFNGTQIQRNYCTLFFARRNDWTPVNQAYRLGLIDYKQAYSR